MLQSKGFRLFILIFGAVILTFGTYAAVRIGDNSTFTLLLIFAVLYVMYVVAWIGRVRKDHTREKQSDGNKSPLRRR